jgi:hypothetical protein
VQSLLNWEIHDTELNLSPEHYLAFQQPGLQMHEEIDVPRGSVVVRVGVFDRDSNKAGTVLVPLRQLSAQAAPSTSN